MAYQQEGLNDQVASTLMSTSTSPITVLVHGAFADASGFTGVIRELGSAGHTVVAPPNPLRSLAFDAAAPRRLSSPRSMDLRCWSVIRTAAPSSPRASATLRERDRAGLLGRVRSRYGRELRQRAAAVRVPRSCRVAPTPPPTTHLAHRTGPNCISATRSSTKPSVRTFLPTCG